MSVYQVDEYYVSVTNGRVPSKSDELEELASNEGLDCTINDDNVTVETFYSESDAEYFLDEVRQVLGI